MSRLAVIGWPIQHSLSPLMHRAALRALVQDHPELAGIDYDVVPVAPDALADFVNQTRREPAWLGFNVTVPHKVAITRLLDVIEPSAEAVGAVNTVVRDSADGLVGLNTDVEGFARALQDAGHPLKGQRVLVLGAGGAARAVVAAAGLGGASAIGVAARDPSKGLALVSLAGAVSFAALPIESEQLSSFLPDLLIQATSASLDPVAGAALTAEIPLSRMHAVVMDLVYRPRLTPLLVRADALGLKTIDGLGMLAHQGALSLSRWIGRAVDAQVMLAALRA